MVYVYVASHYAPNDTQHRLAAALEKYTAEVQVVYIEDISQDDLRRALTDAKVVVVTVQTVLHSPHYPKLSKLLQDFKGISIVYLEDLYKIWRFVQGFDICLGSSLFGEDLRVQNAVAAQAGPYHKPHRPLILQGHFGYTSFDFIDKPQHMGKFLFPSSWFTRRFSPLRCDLRSIIDRHESLKSCVHYILHKHRVFGQAFLKHLQLYPAVLVVVPGVDPLASFVVRKVYEVLSVGSLLMVHFGADNTCAEKAMTKLGFVEGTHYLNVTKHMCEKIKDAIDPSRHEHYSDIRRRGQIFVQTHHSGLQRTEEFLATLKKCTDIDKKI